jgi:hypothetical protein
VPTVQRILALTTALAASTALIGVAGAGSAVTQPSFKFGRVGGNIQPFTVTIARDGSVTSTGPVQPARHQLTARTLARLAALASTEHFFALSQRINCAGSLPDFAYRSLTVSTSATRTRTVLVRGDCRPGYTALYAALAAAVGVRA